MSVDLMERRERLLERAFDKSEALLEKFDSEADVAFQTLKSIHRNVNEKGATRIAAAVSILERASIAPRRRSDDATAAATKVFIGKVAMERIRAACGDVEDADTIDLVEGEYAAEVRPALPAGKIITREAP